MARAAFNLAMPIMRARVFRRATCCVILTLPGAGPAHVKLMAMGFIKSQEKYFKQLLPQRGLVVEKMVQPSLTEGSIARLYAKKELMDDKVKISMIEAKTSIRFGLGAVDEKKNDLEGQVELVSVEKVCLAIARSIEVEESDQGEAFSSLFRSAVCDRKMKQ